MPISLRLSPAFAATFSRTPLTRSRDASFNVNGQRSEFNNFLLDGLDNNAYGTSNQGFSNQAIPPSPDAISEFRVETDNYSAEYGRSAGAVVNVSIRSGTNQFHGKAYDYIRNTVFNAIGPFTPPSNPLTGKPQKPVLIRNQFGGTFGGPIWKDHIFFFGDYEGTRQVVHAVNQATVPTANQNGTSALAIANGGYTFLSGKTAETGGSPVPLVNPLTGQSYSNGVIPFNDPSVSSFAKGVLAALPQPNVPGIPSATTTHRFRPIPSTTTRATFVLTTPSTLARRLSSATASIKARSLRRRTFRGRQAATATAMSTSSTSRLLAA